ncbi:MAG: V-type ATP synthase subunit F [Oscillospiraceae bacterium]|jgi:V/A-type H+-transporting ATPase subunit F|nr:V-type ATP synthase subunit F [Oscillospiraceae bacterium]
MDNDTYKIAVIGDKDSVTAFKALGFVTVACETPDEAKSALSRLTYSDEKYAIIYITARLAAQIPGEVAAYREIPVPALIPI